MTTVLCHTCDKLMGHRAAVAGCASVLIHYRKDKTCWYMEDRVFLGLALACQEVRPIRSTLCLFQMPAQLFYLKCVTF